MKKNYYIKMNLLIPVLLLILYSGSINRIYGQDTDVLERKLNSISVEYNDLLKSVNSFKQALSDKLMEIEAARKSGESDKVKMLMAASVTVSDKIDAGQKKLNSLSEEIESVKKRLDEKYAAEIDSVSALEKSGNFGGDKSLLRNRIVELVEKRLRVAPSAAALSFIPEKILAINPADAKTDEERKIYSEYLRGALSEVEGQIETAKKLRAEVEQILNLQEKTRKFLEDVEFDTEPGVSNLLASGKTTAAQPEDSRNSFATQAQSFLLLIQQLGGSNVKQRDAFLSTDGKKNISLKDYAEILLEAERKLNDYRTALNHRLGNSKR